MSKQLRHTPGPWHAEHQCIFDEGPPLPTMIRSSHGNGTVVDINGGLVPDHLDDTISFDEIFANAYLIAAAPELLEALIDARRQLEQYEMERTGEHYNNTDINAAIAKATGGDDNASS